MASKNQLLYPKARHMLEHLKYEVASELGVTDYATIDRGSLPSRVNGAIGGNMVRYMIVMASQQMANEGNTGGLPAWRQGIDRS